MYLTEPKEARETWTADCEECQAQGEVMIADGSGWEPCGLCDGTGQVEYVPEEDPYAPDYWKDAL
jgi:DnaJ-class molecular chaperone